MPPFSVKTKLVHGFDVQYLKNQCGQCWNDCAIPIAFGINDRPGTCTGVIEVVKHCLFPFDSGNTYTAWIFVTGTEGFSGFIQSCLELRLSSPPMKGFLRF